MVISHNMAAMNANRQYNIVQNSRAKTTEKLSSGYRINRAADDAAGLSISEKMRRQVRGLTQASANCQDGVSLVQVADGALDEVQEMIIRVEELSVKAANGTLDTQDRFYIQSEIGEIRAEIQRISDETTFNEIPLFNGSTKIVEDANGEPMIPGNIPFKDFKLMDLTLEKTPFNDQSASYVLGLKAIVKNDNSAFNNQEFNLIYGSGSTSNSSLRINYLDDSSNEQNIVVNLGSGGNVTPSNYSSDGSTWKRDFVFSDATSGINVTITQKVQIVDTDTDKHYTISYEFENNSTKQVTLDFMSHFDTAYNNNDRRDNFYIAGTKVTGTSVFANSGATSLLEGTSAYYKDMTGGSFSNVDDSQPLPFSEQIKFGDCDYLSIGYYSDICNWSYYDKGTLASNLGGNTAGADLGISMIWSGNSGRASSSSSSLKDMKNGKKAAISFDFGIVPVENDSNFPPGEIKPSKEPLKEHVAKKQIDIHADSEAGILIPITIGEMNTHILGFDNLDVTTQDSSREAMDISKNALSYVSSMRSTIGAQQNRLEHTIDNLNNVVENTTAAESAIRDADMAKEMVKFSIQNILSQAGESMLAQANQSSGGVLNLLQG